MIFDRNIVDFSGKWFEKKKGRKKA